MNLVDDNDQPRSTYYELYMDVPFVSEDQAAVLNDQITAVEGSQFDFLKSSQAKLRQSTIQAIEPKFDIAAVSNTGQLRISFNQEFKTFDTADIDNKVLSLSFIS